MDSDISNSVVGLRSFIDRGSRLARTVFMGEDYSGGGIRSSPQRPGTHYPGVGEGTQIENAIIDKNAAIGNRCVITNAKGVQEGEGPGFYIRDGIVVVVRTPRSPTAP